LIKTPTDSSVGNLIPVEMLVAPLWKQSTYTLRLRLGTFWK